MTINFDSLTTARLAEAFGSREGIPAAAARNAGLDGIAALARVLADKTSCITMLAGSGSRWVSSLAEARAEGRFGGVDPAEARGLFPVRNAMGFGPDPVPIAGYALAAVRDLGSHVIVVRGWEREIEERILSPLSYRPLSWRFVTQEAPGGKPRGHGDAAFQSMDAWSGSEYVIVNFGGDASSPLTALSSLAAIDALSRLMGPAAPGLIMPVAFVDTPAYPIAIDVKGLPRSFGHAKLQKGAAAALSSGGRAGGRTVKTVSEAGGGYTNVGVRVYRADALRDAIVSLRRDHWTAAGGYALPGNDPEGGEFALDNVDAFLASKGLARLLPVARPEELSPVKSVGDLPRFERDVATVCLDWDVLRAEGGRSA